MPSSTHPKDTGSKGARHILSSAKKPGIFRVMPSELRKDYLQDRYVIIAPGRAKRPHGDIPNVCSFCPEQIDKEKALMIVGDKHNWKLKVVGNKFAAVSENNPKAYGRQELVIETPRHDIHFEELSEDAIAAVLDIYAARTSAIAKDKKIEYILVFKNEGGMAGASLAHAHSQILATGFIPPHLVDKSQKALEYRLTNGTCVFCDIIATETKSSRLVYADDEIVAFTPYASRHDYELWIFPKRHIDNVTEASASERLHWAKVLKKALVAISDLGLPYNYYFHQVIRDREQHLYMKVTPRGSTWAGIEIGSGVIINSVAPEDAAAYYRSKFQI